MATQSKEYNPLFLVITGLAAWVVPGGGYFFLKDMRRALVVFVTIVLTFLMGLYIGSIGVIDQIHAKPWYMAQLINSPAVMLIGQHVKAAYLRAQARIDAAETSSERSAAQAQARKEAYYVFARPNEIGQIYTSIAGLLNLLCIVNAVHISHIRQIKPTGDA